MEESKCIQFVFIYMYVKYIVVFVKRFIFWKWCSFIHISINFCILPVKHGKYKKKNKPCSMNFNWLLFFWKVWLNEHCFSYIYGWFWYFHALQTNIVYLYALELFDQRWTVQFTHKMSSGWFYDVTKCP